ncbi:hypothetical protein [Sandarakinorhabdus sp.]|uniref:hypothetical protein n=1 Tax=Sandarakinorhabdus sp. TaxID=1916663 RepID=UPI0033428F5E
MINFALLPASAPTGGWSAIKPAETRPAIGKTGKWPVWHKERRLHALQQSNDAPLFAGLWFVTRPGCSISILGSRC